MPVTTSTHRVGRATASGPLPYRVLLVGSAPVAGDDALAEAIADGLAARTAHGVDLDRALARPVGGGPDGSPLGGRDLSRIDALVVVLDPERARRAAVGPVAVLDLLAGLAGRLTAGSALVLVVPPAFAAGLTPRQTDDLADLIRAHTDALTPVVQLEDDATDAPEQRSARWADAIAAATASALIDPMVEFVPDDHFDEDERLEAVDRLPPRDGLWVAQFERIVEDAREAYGATSAALSIVDADHARYGVTVGFPVKAVRRGQTICNRVLRTYGGLIVGDARLDLRFQRNPDVRSGDVRFYAGYRIESEDGAPLGSLCVFDPAPRDAVHEQDLVALRDLAIAAQQRLWSFQRAVAS